MAKVNVALIRSRLIERGYVKKNGEPNYKAASLDAALGETGIRDLLTSGRAANRNPQQRTVTAVGKLLGLSSAEILSEPTLARSIPVVGHVSAGDGWMPVGDDEKETEEFAVSETAFALRVRGDSMYPVYRDGDLLIASGAQKSISNLIGQDCIVELTDGQRYVKKLTRGSERRLYTLHSYNRKEIEDVEIAWAAPIIWIRRS